MRKSLLAACLFAALSIAGSADAADYVSTRTVGDATASLSITTDDTLGVLTTDNILDWTVVLTRGSLTETLFGPESGDNSRVQVRGNALTATATQLLFDFGAAANSFLLFQSTDLTNRSLYCVQTTNCFDQSPAEFISFGPLFNNFTRESRSGSQVIAATAAVPEPETWLTMITGLALAGLAMRRRKGQAALAA